MNFPFFRDFLTYLDRWIPVLDVGSGMIAVSPRIDIRMQLQLNSITTDLLPSKGNVTKLINLFFYFRPRGRQFSFGFDGRLNLYLWVLMQNHIVPETAS